MRQVRGLLEPLAAGLVQPRRGKAARVGPLLDRSEQVYACLTLPAPGAGAGGGKPGAQLAVTGRWTPSLLGARLDWSCGWSRHQSSPEPYWSERRSGLEVGSPAPGLLLAAFGQPGAMERMAARWTARRLSRQAGPVELVREQDPRIGPFLAGAALYAYLPVAGGELPLRELWLAAQKEQGQYELGALAALEAPGGTGGGRAGEAGAPSARALTALVRLAAAGWLRKAGIPEVAARLRAMEIEVVEGGLSVRGLRLPEPEMLALLQSLLPPDRGTDARSGD